MDSSKALDSFLFRISDFKALDFCELVLSIFDGLINILFVLVLSCTEARELPVTFTEFEESMFVGAVCTDERSFFCPNEIICNRMYYDHTQ